MIGSLLGYSGMSEVWRARHAHLKTQVAIKILATRLAHKEEFNHRFIREAQRQAPLRHTNIVQVLDFFEHEGYPCLVLEFVDGESLAERMRPTPPLTIQESIEIIRMVLPALGYAHRNGTIHRDIKPSNICWKWVDMPRGFCSCRVEWRTAHDPDRCDFRDAGLHEPRADH